MGNPIADGSDAKEARDEHRCGRLLTGADLATFLGYSVNAIEAWLRDGMPCKRPGSKGVAHRYDSAQVVQWLIRREVDRARKGFPAGPGSATAKPGADGGEVQKAGYKERLGWANVRKMELELALAEGKVVSIETAERVLSNLAGGVRSKVLSFPVRLAPIVAVRDDVDECRRILDEAVYEVLTDISKIEPTAFLREDAAELVGEKE